MPDIDGPCGTSSPAGAAQWFAIVPELAACEAADDRKIGSTPIGSAGTPLLSRSSTVAVAPPYPDATIKASNPLLDLVFGFAPAFV
jgi:hypothetical protein